jgi:rhodanese-related sulfurtransferase
MREISCHDLKQKIDANEDFKLVFCLEESQFQRKHIPGSICFPVSQKSTEDMTKFREHMNEVLSVSEDIVVYCSHSGCSASIFMYNELDRANYSNIHRFSGGIKEWEEEGFSFDGDGA